MYAGIVVVNDSKKEINELNSNAELHSLLHKYPNSESYESITSHLGYMSNSKTEDGWQPLTDSFTAYKPSVG